MQKFHIGMVLAAVFLAGCSTSAANDKSGTETGVTRIKAKTVRIDKLAGYNSKQIKIANTITARFAAAGYGPAQQIAAVSVAIRESTLNPKARNRGCNCYGLFQMNRSGGLGRGHSVANLTRADYNISLIIKEANRFPSFSNAKSVNQAVTAFVRHVTRSGNKPGVVRATMRTARKVQNSADTHTVASRSN